MRRQQPLASRALLLLATAVPLAACSGSLPDPALVQELRILAIRASPPETTPGTTSNLQALVADPLGGGRTLSWQWSLCTPDPTQGVSSCAVPGRITPLGTGTAQTLLVQSNALAGLSPQDQETGIDLFGVLALHGDATSTRQAEDDLAFKRLRVSTSTTPDQNPVLAAFSIGGDQDPTVAVAAGQQVSLTAWSTTASIQTYQTPTGPVTDTMRFDWLVTAGAVDDDVTFGETANPTLGVTGWTAQDGAPPATIWTVLRNGREGVDWQTRQVAAP